MRGHDAADVTLEMVRLEVHHAKDNVPVYVAAASTLGVSPAEGFQQIMQTQVVRAIDLLDGVYADWISRTEPNLIAFGLMQGITLAVAMRNLAHTDEVLGRTVEVERSDLRALLDAVERLNGYGKLGADERAAIEGVRKRVDTHERTPR